MLGDFNACVGSRAGIDDEGWHERGPHGYGELNETRMELLCFLSTNDATVCNTWFEKKCIHTLIRTYIFTCMQLVTHTIGMKPKALIELFFPFLKLVTLSFIQCIVSFSVVQRLETKLSIMYIQQMDLKAEEK